METQQREKLLNFRKAAEEKQKEGKFLSDKAIALLLVRVLPTTNSLTLADTLKQDLRGMLLFDALASWCDPDGGLAKYFPDAITQIAEQLLPLENK